MKNILNNCVKSKKRVICLYRVSTTQQVFKSQDDDRAKDDIPMQKIVCRDFADRMDWVVVDEMYEKGVSGYKKSANDRDAIIELRERALRRHSPKAPHPAEPPDRESGPRYAGCGLKIPPEWAGHIQR